MLGYNRLSTPPPASRRARRAAAGSVSATRTSSGIVSAIAAHSGAREGLNVRVMPLFKALLSVKYRIVGATLFFSELPLRRVSRFRSCMAGFTLRLALLFRFVAMSSVLRQLWSVIVQSSASTTGLFATQYEAFANDHYRGSKIRGATPSAPSVRSDCRTDRQCPTEPHASYPNAERPLCVGQLRTVDGGS